MHGGSMGHQQDMVGLHPGTRVLFHPLNAKVPLGDWSEAQGQSWRWGEVGARKCGMQDTPRLGR